MRARNPKQTTCHRSGPIGTPECAGRPMRNVHLMIWSNEKRTKAHLTMASTQCYPTPPAARISSGDLEGKDPPPELAEYPRSVQPLLRHTAPSCPGRLRASLASLANQAFLPRRSSRTGQVLGTLHVSAVHYSIVTARSSRAPSATNSQPVCLVVFLVDQHYQARF